MFSNAYQSGLAVQIISVSDKNPQWKITRNNWKQYDKSVKGYVILLDTPNSRLSYPDTQRQSLALVQRYLVLQCYLHPAHGFSLQIGVCDISGVKRRLLFTHSTKQLSLSTLQARIPTHNFLRGLWMNLSIDIIGHLGALYPAATFRSIDSITIRSFCKLRRVFTMRCPVVDHSLDQQLPGVQAIPRTFEFPIGIQTTNQLILADRFLSVKTFNKKESTVRKNTLKQLQAKIPKKVPVQKQFKEKPVQELKKTVPRLKKPKIPQEKKTELDFSEQFDGILEENKDIPLELTESINGSLYEGALMKISQFRPFTPPFHGLRGLQTIQKTTPKIQHELFYDPELRCYFDPSTNQYYETLQQFPHKQMEETEIGIYQSTVIILFANGKSGGNKAQKYLDLGLRSLNIQYQSLLTEVFIFNLGKINSRRSGVNFIANQIQKAGQATAIVAGGDGSLIWLIQEILEAQIDISLVKLGILPFGTGNDLSSMLGWGRSPPSPILGKNLKGFRTYVEQWQNASPHPLDIWNIQIQLQTDGYVQVIQRQSRRFSRKHLTDLVGSDLKIYKRMMTNYFSMGLDARIGLGFDKKRSTSKVKNRCVYCWEGLKKICCLAVPRMADIAQDMIQDDLTIFDNQGTQERLPLNTSVLLILNSQTYGGGENYVWNKSRRAHSRRKAENFSKSDPRDGLVQIMTFHGAFDLGLEQVPCTAGRANRLHQSAGPFTINFKPFPPDRRVYMQIDGEYFYAVRPKKAHISLSYESTHKLINVLKKDFN